MQIIKDEITLDKLKQMAEEMFGDLVKAVVDVEKEIMAIGGELHADEEAMLIKHSSKQQNLWGINLYPELDQDSWVEFDSMINLRPSQGNRSRGVDDPEVQQKIINIVNKLVQK